MRLKRPRDWRPLFVNNSRVPVWLSKIAPINIWAISFGPFVFCREKIQEPTTQHETIHFQQQLELAFVGQWFLYGVFFLIGWIKWKSAAIAYIRNPFEQEAYLNQGKKGYLSSRRRWGWVKYVSFTGKG
jgi:hypothetical protein